MGVSSMAETVTAYIVSAFSKDGRGGNRAGVVTDSTGLTREQKCAIAGKLGYSETVFLSPSASADFRLEYFTPVDEVPLCGHATIAAFSLLHLQGRLDKPCYTIETKAGLLQIRISRDGCVFMEQNLPQYLAVLTPEKLGRCVAREGFSEALPIQIVSTGLRDILLPVSSAEALGKLTPDFAAMAELSREQDVIGVHAFALCDDPNITAVCRNFAPLYGIDEESATGTSNCALACYLFRYAEKKPEYIFEQGHWLGAVSRIAVKLDYTGDTIQSVFVGGFGYLDGEPVSLSLGSIRPGT